MALNQNGGIFVSEFRFSENSFCVTQDGEAVEKDFFNKMKLKAIIVSGYFNPIHKGHIEYFKNAKSKGAELFVVVNSDFQRELKESKEFQDEKERMIIVQNLKLVDKCFLSVDRDRTVNESIKMIFNQFGSNYQLSFANGGDQNNDTIPEKKICEELGIELIDRLGGKIQSSSWLLNRN